MIGPQPAGRAFPPTWSVLPLGATVVVPRPVDPEPETRPDGALRRLAVVAGVETVLVLAAAGAVLGLGLAYRLASAGSPWRSVAFWLPLLGFLAVVVAVILDRRVDGLRRGLALALTGFVMAAPTVIRTPDLPLYLDEIALWRPTDQLVATGSVLTDDVATILRDHPGLHALTTALERATGLSTWTLGTVLLVVLRVAVPVLAATVARTAGLSPRAADVAGLVYALNPGFMILTGRYDAESLAIVLQLAVLGLLGMVVAGSRGPAGAARRLAVLLTAAVTMTHHLTSIVLLTMVLALVVLHTGRIGRRDLRRLESRRRVARLGATLVLVVLAWTAVHATEVWGSLPVFPQRAAEQFAGLVAGLVDGLGAGLVDRLVDGRTGNPSAAAAPGYEVVIGLLGVSLLTLLGVAGALCLRRLRGVPDTRLVVVVAAAYPASLPFVLTVHGAPAAHRAWPFAWQGLCVLVGAALAAVAGLQVRGSADPGRPVRYGPPAGTIADLVAAVEPARVAAGQGAHRRRRLRSGCRAVGRTLGSRPVRGLAVLSVLGVVLVGGVENNTARFPGASVLGSQGRVQTPELLAAARWAGGLDAGRGGPGAVGGDYYGVGYLAGIGNLAPVQDFPVWDLLRHPGPVPPATLARLPRSGLGLLVIDRRIGAGRPATGFSVDASEPPTTAPIPVAALDALETYPWLAKVWAGTAYDVYRVLPEQVEAPQEDEP